MSLAPAIAATAAYLLAAILQWRRPGAVRAIAVSAAAGLACHALVLLDGTVRDGQLALGITEALSLFAGQAALLLWLLGMTLPVRVLGLAIYPLAAGAAIGAALWPTSLHAIPLADWKIQLHVLLSLLAAGLLTLAAAQALTLAVQDRLLHRHSPHPFGLALPPLLTMEQLLFLLIGLGFFLLSLALLSGLLFVDDLMAQHLAHKTLLSVVAWVLFGSLLWGRWRRGWRGRTAVRWTLAGYTVLVLAYFGSKLVLEQILSRHWT